MTERTLDTSKYIYEFVGGEYNGKMWQYAALEARNLIKGYNTDLSEQRAKGVLCHRAELDNQPLIDGYLTPMWGGTIYNINGVPKYDFECSEAEKANREPIMVIRYETQEAYDMLSR